MVQRVGVRVGIIAVPVGRSRDPRQRRVEVLWVKACGGEVFIDPSGRRFAVFPEHAVLPKSLLRERASRVVDEVPAGWMRLG